MAPDKKVTENRVREKVRAVVYRTLGRKADGIAGRRPIVTEAAVQDLPFRGEFAVPSNALFTPLARQALIERQIHITSPASSCPERSERQRAKSRACPERSERQRAKSRACPERSERQRAKSNGPRSDRPRFRSRRFLPQGRPQGLPGGAGLRRRRLRRLRDGTRRLSGFRPGRRRACRRSARGARHPDRWGRDWFERGG
ncbi:MAG: hypothetical protein HW375_2331 [Anaerolineales bacterium]|nr:hypothetical protein [Anaerolineales bacterium]